MLDKDSDRVRTHEYFRNQVLERLQMKRSRNDVYTIGKNPANDNRFSLRIVNLGPFSQSKHAAGKSAIGVQQSRNGSGTGVMVQQYGTTVYVQH